jgi:hypothetical protein
MIIALLAFGITVGIYEYGIRRMNFVGKSSDSAHSAISSRLSLK